MDRVCAATGFHDIQTAGPQSINTEPVDRSHFSRLRSVREIEQFEQRSTTICHAEHRKFISVCVEYRILVECRSG